MYLKVDVLLIYSGKLQLTCNTFLLPLIQIACKMNACSVCVCVYVKIPLNTTTFKLKHDVIECHKYIIMYL